MTPSARDGADYLEDLLDHDRRESHARFIEEKQARPAHQGASDREHLLLSSGKGTGELVAALGKTRKESEHALQIRGYLFVVAGVRADLEVLLHLEPSEDATAFRHQRDAPADQVVRGAARDRLPFVFNMPARNVDEAGDSLQSGGFSCPVGADERNDLALHHIKVDALHGVDATVGNLEIAHFQERRSVHFPLT